MWPMRAVPNIAVENNAGRIVRAALRRERFNADGDQCAPLLQTLTGFIQHVCEHYNGEIDNALARPDERRSVQDFVSWVVSDLEQFLGVALQIFRGRLVDHLSLDFSMNSPIRCSESAPHTDWLPAIYCEASHLWRQTLEAPISSRRGQRRREHHTWMPRHVDICDLARNYFDARR